MFLAGSGAAAGWRPIETTCAAGQPACFEELAKASKSCKLVRKQSADTTRGEVSIEWRRCPAPGFKTVKGSDYVMVTGEEGGLWGFTNVADPSSASVSDVGFLGTRWILVQAFAATGASASWCLLGLSPSPPRCLLPPIPELEAKVQSLLKEGETLCCKDWSLEEVTRWKMVAVRPVFKDKKPVANIRATLSVNREDLGVRRVRREEVGKPAR
jgi:hypothetical protein